MKRIRLQFLIFTWLFCAAVVFAQETIEVPIVQGERFGNQYGIITINTPELDSMVVAEVNILYDSLATARGILLDIRRVWLDQDSAAASQTPFFATLLDSAPPIPVVILTLPDWPGNDEMKELVKKRPLTHYDHSGDVAEGKRSLKKHVLNYEKGGRKIMDDLMKEKEELEKLEPVTPPEPVPQPK
jgi:hypothetical protein